MKKKIAQVVFGLPLEGPFDYLIPEDGQAKISLGQRVYVSFQNRYKVGYVVGFRKQSPYPKLKTILTPLDNGPVLNAKALKLTKTFSDYYGCSWGEAIETSLPLALRRKQPMPFSLPPQQKNSFVTKAEIVLCHDQGLTGRWPFLIQQIKENLGHHKGVIFLVPIVSLIKKIQKILQDKLDFSITVLDRQLTNKEERDQWRNILEGKVKMVIGTRSAIFTPVADLGLIIVYEEEHTSYKQEQSPFYHVREVALMRRKIEDCSLIFVSSYPSTEVWWQAKKKKINLRSFPSEYLSPIQWLDLSNYKPRRRSTISFPLQNSIQTTLDQQGKSLLYYNRRGFSTITLCHQCGFIVTCPRCQVNLSYLYSQKKLICHLCQKSIEVPKVCPNCQGSYLHHLGRGIEKVASEVSLYFPQARVAKYDRETQKIPLDFDILVATQAVFKDLDHLSIDLVGVLEIDSQFNRLDFRSAQKVFALLYQFRQYAKEKIVVQTFLKDNYCLQAVATADFGKFYQKELEFLKELGFPPFQHLIHIGFRGPKEEIVLQQAKDFYERLIEKNWKDAELTTPQADLVKKLRDQYRFIIVLKCSKVIPAISSIKSVIKTFRRKRGVIVTINVDP